MTREYPFDGETKEDIFEKVLLSDPTDPVKVDRRIPKDLSVICMKALEKKSDDRYQTMKAFSEDLNNYLSGRPIVAKPCGRVMRIWKYVKRRRAMSFSIVGVLAAVVLIVFSAQWYVALQDKKVALQDKKYENLKRRNALKEDLRIAQDLMIEADTLYPPLPSKRDGFSDWIGRASDLVAKRSEYEDDLKRLRHEWAHDAELNRRMNLFESVRRYEARKEKALSGLFDHINERLSECDASGSENENLESVHRFVHRYDELKSDIRRYTVYIDEVKSELDLLEESSRKGVGPGGRIYDLYELLMRLDRIAGDENLYELLMRLGRIAGDEICLLAGMVKRLETAERVKREGSSKYQEQWDELLVERGLLEGEYDYERGDG